MFKCKFSQSLFNGSFSLEVQYNGVWLGQSEWQSRGLTLTVEENENSDDLQSCRIRLTAGNEMFRLGGIRLVSNPGNGQIPGEDIRLYLEGWDMATPCGMRKYGDTDFIMSKEYLPFAVAEPADYVRETPNRFRAEYAVGIQNTNGSRTALIGFVTTADQYGRFQLELRKDGLKLAVIAGFDDRQVDPGETVITEEIAFFTNGDMNTLLDRYADLWAKRMNARKKLPLPIGWCSWYYYFNNVTEKDVLENIDFLDQHREYPLEYIQLDDGYQPACGDWLGYCEKFPHGLRYWAEEAGKKGFKPALWLAPFQVEKRSELFRAHPEWCIPDREGNVIFPTDWRGEPLAILDGTHPGVQEHFRKLFAELRQMGFVYVKLDFMAYSSSVRNGVLHDRKATRAQAFRRGLSAIREGFGDDGFILGCTAPFGPCAGLVDGERIATDITPYWYREHFGRNEEAPTVPNVCRNGIQHAYMHRKLWYNDPDTHIARIDNNELTEEEVKLWTAALRINSGMLLLSDRFSTLTPERLAYSKMLLDDPDAFAAVPLDRMERTIPAVWKGVRRDGKGSVYGVFNLTNGPLSIPCPWGEAKGREIFSGKPADYPEELPPHTVFAVELP